jgi:hypothetical protein
MSTAANYVMMTVSGTPGTGTITLNAASSGFRSFATAYGADATVDVRISDGSAWEVARNCAYTHSGTTLTRGTLENSSTGSALSLTSAATVEVVLPASAINNYTQAMSSVLPGGRLTLESGVPVSTTDQTAKTSIFYTPFVHNVVPLWNGTDWVPTTFTEVTQALGTITSGRPYDVFGFLNGSALNTEILAWTNDTTRATAVTLQDGRYCKSGDKTRLLLGTFYTTSTTTTEDSGATAATPMRYVWNAYNRVTRVLRRVDTTDSWAGPTSSTWRQANSSTANECRVISGLPGVSTVSFALCVAGITPAGTNAMVIAVGEDSTTAYSPFSATGYYQSDAPTSLQTSTLCKPIPLGWHKYTWLEALQTGSTGGGTFYGDAGLPSNFQSAMIGWCEA